MPPRAPGRRRASHATGFWFVAVAFTVLMAFGTAPTPLWPLYEARDHFGATTVPVAYASMVVGAAGAFLGLGHLSDRLGRRRIIVPALLVGILASVVLIVWRDLPGLIAGRVLNGVGLGLMASTATTYLHDLHHEVRPDRTGSVLPGVVATAANLGGLASGPLVAGAVAEWLPAPLITAQVIFTLAMAVCLALVLCTPETVAVDLDLELPAARPSRFVLRPGGRRAFGAAGALGAFAFAILGLISSLGASVLHFVLGRIGRFGARATAAFTALAGFLLLYLVPIIKYPANPPAVGNPDSIGERTILFVGMIALSVLLGIAAILLGRKLAPAWGNWNASIAAGVAFVAAMAVTMAVLPQGDNTPKGFPATDLWEFRVASIGIQAALWASFGLLFGFLAERVLEPKRVADRAVSAAA
ncbi:CbtA family protein [Streptomyces nigra]